MSYAKEVKKTLIKMEEKNDAERREKLCGILRGAGSLTLSSGGVSFEISTESYELIKKTARLLKALYRLTPEIFSESNRLNSNDRFTVSVHPPQSEEVLFDLRLLAKDEEGGKTIYRSFSSLYPDADAAKNFLTGMFLGCGSVSIPNDSSLTGYHLEFVTAIEETAEELSHLLASFDFIPKKVARKNGFVVYLKESEAICDFFAFLGASKVVLELQEIMTERNLSNNLNRQANCQAANIDKTVAASVKQVEAIEVIASTIGMDSLPKHLREIAYLRLENPTDTLDELADKLGEGVTKSGINHRFRKLVKIAGELGGGQNDF